MAFIHSMLVLKYVFILLPASFSAYRQRIIHPFLTRGPLDIFLIILQNIVQYFMNNTGIAKYLAQMTDPCIGKYNTKVSYRVFARRVNTFLISFLQFFHKMNIAKNDIIHSKFCEDSEYAHFEKVKQS